MTSSSVVLPQRFSGAVIASLGAERPYRRHTAYVASITECLVAFQRCWAKLAASLPFGLMLTISKRLGSERRLNLVCSGIWRIRIRII
jgi:hypothetical protein